ncbi:MAG TPA: ATP-binding protein, partial [Spirochaetota bacterium]|nr:ATP-binding protein [Spirochaetota bacterium]
DSKFLDAFISEKCEYMIRNLLFEADSISHRITDNLQKYMDKSEVNLIRIGLREIIINSIEHGNLNITFEEKSEAIMNDRYFSFLNQRQNHPEYKDRRVRIEYLISPTKAVYKITDQGKGFNHKKYMNNELLKDNLAHGRGIAMVRNIFDEVRYNFRGNQVLLVKYLGDDDLKQVNDISDSIQEEQVNAEVS